jgi:hypothetical protein
VAFGDSARGERTGGDPPLVVRTVLHPHPESRFITVTLAAIDLARVAMHLTAGTEDLSWAKISAPPDAGLVPERDRGDLLFVMNGGFQPKHGRWGLVANGSSVSKPRPDGCSVLLDDGGGVRIGPTSQLAGAIDGARSVRQTPPCLLDGGAVHPALLAGNDKAWAGHAADLRTRRRSAIGIDPARNVLFYAIGEETEPRHLAEALRLAEAEEAAELDINWYWTRFLLVGAENGALRITSTLIPKMEHQETEYVARPSTRDFFYALAKKAATP